MAAFVAMKIFERGEDSGTRGTDTRAKFKRAQDALVSFAAQNQRLPCPADPSAEGDEAPLGGNAVCASPTGTLPWKTIGASRDDAYDAWGNRISYRVFSGATGLTQANGASMVNCDTSNLDPVTGVVMPTAVLGPDGLCAVAHDHLAGLPLPAVAGTYLFGKGLQVNDFGTIRTDIAYVLVSHGPSGLGAYTSAGIRKALPTSASELANINTTTPATQFVAQASSPPEVDPNAATHFDDLLAFQGISEILTQANLLARDWPESSLFTPANSVIDYTMNNATVAAAIGGAVSSGDLGTNRINFGAGANRASVRGLDAGGSQDIAFDTTGGSPALGVAGNGGDLLSSANSERLRIDFGTHVNKLGIAMAHFGTFVVSGTTFTERVQFTFSCVGAGCGGASTVTVVKSGCHADGGVASFSIDPATQFTRVVIQPLSATPSGNSATALADFNVCNASAVGCFSKLATAGNSCP